MMDRLGFPDLYQSWTRESRAASGDLMEAEEAVVVSQDRAFRTFPPALFDHQSKQDIF